MPEQVDPATLEAWLADDEERDTLVLDVRTPPEYDLGHLPGAANVPLAGLPSAISDLDIPERVVFVCEVGTASEQAGRLLESSERVDEDTAVYNLAGGMREWDGPVTRDSHTEAHDET
ncbi:MAG: rhodanese-like domain-containing protein [Halanaeroarchaeum sp.]